jgi:ribonuclease VapC
MKRIVFDSYALISYFRKEPGYTTIKEILLKIASNELDAYICSINVGEIYYMICRKVNPAAAEAALQVLKQLPIHIIDAGLALCLQAAAIKAKHSLSYADAFAAAITIDKRATLITGDKEFEALKKEANFKVKYL